MPRYAWTKFLKRSAPELPYDSPIYLGPWSNGEFFHEQTAHERKLHRRILEVGDQKARKLGIDRREFMASAMGFVTALSVIQEACGGSSGGGGGNGGTSSVAPPSTGNGMQGGVAGSSGASALAGTGGAGGMSVAGGAAASGAGTSGSGGATAGGSGASGAGGTAGMDPGMAAQPGQYCFDQVAGVDPTMCDEAAREILQPTPFIFDGQTHCFDDAPDAAWRSSPPPGFNESLSQLLFGRCTDDPVSCIGPDDYVRLMFLESTTTMAVLSAWPYGQGQSDPNSNPFLASTRDWINKDLAGSQRVVNHASVVPWIGTRGMDMAVSSFGVGGWKVYPAAGGDVASFFMDDATGRGFIEHAIELGVKTFAIHKGLPIAGFSVEHNMPRDIGVVAKDYPEVNFVVYHSSICAGQMGSGFTCQPMEGPYVPGSMEGTDALITSLMENGIAPNSNVFAELGGAFSQMMSNPSAAGQWLAKLVQYVGENNVVWGTDSILTGNSPQGQISAFMALQHPMLTPQVKEKILGRNMARLYCVDPDKQRCQVDQSKLMAYKRDLDGEFGDYRWVLLGHQRPLGPTTRREFLKLARFEREQKMKARLRG
jgi:predicted TIM-barrel fold metal-dependent hydrolase